MEHIISNGNCPECFLKGKSVMIILNKEDSWECPECDLQLRTVSDEHIGILLERGKGHLQGQAYNPTKWGEKILVRRPLFKGDDCIIKNELELKDYLTLIV